MPYWRTNTKKKKNSVYYHIRQRKAAEEAAARQGLVFWLKYTLHMMLHITSVKVKLRWMKLTTVIKHFSFQGETSLTLRVNKEHLNAALPL